MESKNQYKKEQTIDVLNVRAAEGLDKKLPSKEIVDMQLQIARIVIADALKIQMEHPKKHFNDIIDELSENWKSNIKKFACALAIIE